MPSAPPPEGTVRSRSRNSVAGPHQWKSCPFESPLRLTFPLPAVLVVDAIPVSQMVVVHLFPGVDSHQFTV
jgi:hypothetical protein